MRNSISKILAKEAKGLTKVANGYKTLPTGQVINVGWKGMHRALKKSYMEMKGRVWK